MRWARSANQRRRGGGIRVLKGISIAVKGVETRVVHIQRALRRFTRSSAELVRGGAFGEG